MPTPNSRRSLLLLLAAALPLLAWASGPVNVDASGVAIHGHDPVAYFVDGKAVMGRAEHALSIDGATYWFASEANRKQFEADPERFRPQYGGYCAYGVANGVKPDIDPKAFRIVGGRLYLNLNPDVQKRWQADIPGFVAEADRNWPALKGR